MRLDKFIAQTTECSRSDAKRLIKKGAITVNKVDARDSAQIIDPESDLVIFDNITLNLPSARYFMLNKPAHIVCTNQDSLHSIVIDLLTESKKETLQIAGRLDKDTTGLVFITDDGHWNHRVTAPRSNCFKTYQITVGNPLKKELIDYFEQGILLHNEKKKTRPAKLIIIDDFHAELSIQEGKYHQVKRMFAAAGNHVLNLHRSSIGPITLDSSLKPGEYRALTNKEIHSFAN